jgi:photosystem II stability/assembly factor-like uncharacterized protein
MIAASGLSMTVPARAAAPAVPRLYCGPSVGELSYPTEHGALDDVQFSSPTTGWLVGTSRVERTTDGGAHWANVEEAVGADFGQVDAYDNLHAWVVGRDLVVQTADGGKSWHALPNLCPAISSVDFFSPTGGIALAGNQVLVTHDGGRRWSLLTTPGEPQSVCFADRRDGWLGAHGRIYRTTDAGKQWRLAAAGPHFGKAERGASDAEVQCAGPDAGWAELLVRDAAMNQSPHVGYHLSAARSRPIFSEGYFPYPGLPRLPSSPSSEYAAFSAISPNDAAFVDFCGACGSGRSYVAVVTGGHRVGHHHRVRNIDGASAAAFLSTRDGWVAGSTSVVSRNPGWRLEHTTDGGRTWTTQFQS